jgi:YggT family protein
MYYLANFINILFTVLNFAILIRVLLSWVQVAPGHPLVQFLYKITDPILAPFRKVIPPVAGLDFSPIVAFFVLELLRRLILGLLL